MLLTFRANSCMNIKPICTRRKIPTMTPIFLNQHVNYFLLLGNGPPLWSSGQSFWLQNGDVLCFLWGTKLIYICYVEESRTPLWSSGQSSWLQNGDVLCFLWGTNWIYVCYVEESRLPLWSSGQSSWLQNGDVLCFLWSTSWIYICYVEESRPPLWSSGQSSWLQIQRSGFYYRSYLIFSEVVGLERDPLSLVSTWGATWEK
jgi:hypothetical protein